MAGGQGVGFAEEPEEGDGRLDDALPVEDEESYPAGDLADLASPRSAARSPAGSTETSRPAPPGSTPSEHSDRPGGSPKASPSRAPSAPEPAFAEDRGGGGGGGGHGGAARAQVEALVDGSLPYSREAEESVLGSMLVDVDCVGDVIELLRADDFYLRGHRMVFEAILDLFDRGSGIELTLVAERLLEKKQFDTVGGALALTDLVDRVPSSANVLYHARIVLQRSLLRRLVGAANEILQSARSPGTSVETLVDEAEARIFEVAHRTSQQSSSASFKDTLHELLKSIDQKRDGELEGTPTFYPDLDDKLGGLRGGQMLILAARPSMGKTTFALNVARRVATRANPQAGVIVFSLEMSRQQLAQHFVCAHAQIEANVLRRGRLTVEDSDRLGHACTELAEAPIFIDDTPGLTMLQIRAKARRLRARQNIGLIVVDYLQLVTGPKTESRQLEISHISMSMKQLARELDVPVLALSQLNRSVETRENHRPRMSDLRESGSLEQDADVVMFLHRDEYFEHGKERASRGKAQLIIAKQRNGPIGEVDLTFIPGELRFEPYSELDYLP